MPRLIKWHKNVIDPGMTARSSVDESEQMFSDIAEFDVPVSAEVIYAQRQCPQFFDALVATDGRPNKNLILIGRELQQMVEAPQCYRVRLTYSNKWVNEQNGDKPDVQFKSIQNPLQRPCLVEWGTYVVRETVEEAYSYTDENTPSGDKSIPVVTTAGEPLIIEEEYHRRMLTLNKNVQRVPDIFAENSDFINEEDTNIGGHTFKKYTLWLADLSIGHISMENGVLYYPVSMRIMHNPKTWIRRIRNAGYYMKDFNYVWATDSNGIRKKIFPMKPIILSDGTRANQPILLDDEGRPLQAVITGKTPRKDTRDPGRAASDEFDFTYKIQAPDDFGRAFTKEELKSTIRYFRTKPLLNFTKRLPIF